jgi:hypothetical protein
MYEMRKKTLLEVKKVHRTILLLVMYQFQCDWLPDHLNANPTGYQNYYVTSSTSTQYLWILV